jgi:UPF0755 protein
MSAKRQSKKKDRKVLYIILGVLALIILVAGIKIYEDVLASNVKLEKGKTEYVYVRTHMSFDENMEAMRKTGFLRNTDALKRVIALLGYEGKIKPGRYKLDASVNNLQLAKQLISGRQEPVNVTFKYAERKEDLARFWALQLEADSMEIRALLENDSLAQTLNLNTTTIVSVFIPNTYNFYWNTSAEKLVERMVKEYGLFWDSSRVEKAKALGLSKAEVSVMASIVQKETYQKAEMPVVAGVYYNRLQKGMPFQADPTIIFAMNDRSIRRVAGPMLKINSPYNTYINKGLPPGPICIPSVNAIDAVLNLKPHNYIYFCAKEDFSGYHNFSSSFDQHCNYARKYQRELNRRGIR